MAKKKVQVLLDEQEARQIYDKVDWNWLFNFVRNCFGIGTPSSFPTPHIRNKKDFLTGIERPNVTLIWNDELKEHCGPLAVALQSVKLMATSTKFYKEVDAAGNALDRCMSLTLSFQLASATEGYNYPCLLTAIYSEKKGWLIKTANALTFKQGKAHLIVH